VCGNTDWISVYAICLWMYLQLSQCIAFSCTISNVDSLIKHWCAWFSVLCGSFASYFSFCVHTMLGWMETWTDKH